MQINVLESPTLYASELGYIDSIITPLRLIDNISRNTSIERVICIFKCQHADVSNDEDGVYCHNCNNHDLTVAQIEDFQEKFEAARRGKYDGDE